MFQIPEFSIFSSVSKEVKLQALLAVRGQVGGPAWQVGPALWQGTTPSEIWPLAPLAPLGQAPGEASGATRVAPQPMARQFVFCNWSQRINLSKQGYQTYFRWVSCGQYSSLLNFGSWLRDG
jgi:hypothetical protein